MDPVYGVGGSGGAFVVAWGLSVPGCGECESVSALELDAWLVSDEGDGVDEGEKCL